MGGVFVKFQPEQLETCYAKEKRLSAACIALFQRDLSMRLKGQFTFAAILWRLVGDLSNVPDWAWLRQETLVPDLKRVYRRVTGLEWPGEDPLELPDGHWRPPPPAQVKWRGNTCSPSRSTCYAVYYESRDGPRLVERIIKDDAVVFEKFGYSTNPLEMPSCLQA
jgi:hypothetical protein